MSPKSVYYSVLAISSFIKRVLRCIFCCRKKQEDDQEDEVFNGEEVAPGVAVRTVSGLADNEPATLYKYGQCPSGELSAYFNAKAASEPYQNFNVLPNPPDGQQPYSQSIVLKSMNPLGAESAGASGVAGELPNLLPHNSPPAMPSVVLPASALNMSQGKGGRPMLCLRCEKRRRYLEITRKLVSRYIHQRKKAYRDEMVNEDDLLEIRQDISSFRCVPLRFFSKYHIIIFKCN